MYCCSAGEEANSVLVRERYGAVSALFEDEASSCLLQDLGRVCLSACLCGGAGRAAHSPWHPSSSFHLSPNPPFVSATVACTKLFSSFPLFCRSCFRVRAEKRRVDSRGRERKVRERERTDRRGEQLRRLFRKLILSYTPENVQARRAVELTSRVSPL